MQWKPGTHNILSARRMDTVPRTGVTDGRGGKREAEVGARWGKKRARAGGLGNLRKRGREAAAALTKKRPQSGGSADGAGVLRRTGQKVGTGEEGAAQQSTLSVQKMPLASAPTPPAPGKQNDPDQITPERTLIPAATAIFLPCEIDTDHE
ncbi:hypothetical protein N658DRAFT_267527 [Parathielavia hyrcaniae]|uniref:Uncharacterized protein n=1 Tax=Parathielavia hyrcaniae TaxID=113614 RepID=A0AAN6SYI1_9PEZI|nr:hypothetical protein N658DRAFT_267527 [Parathielavia hyrcaniae]